MDKRDESCSGHSNKADMPVDKVKVGSMSHVDKMEWLSNDIKCMSDNKSSIQSDNIGVEVSQVDKMIVDKAADIPVDKVKVVSKSQVDKMSDNKSSMQSDTSGTQVDKRGVEVSQVDNMAVDETTISAETVGVLNRSNKIYGGQSIKAEIPVYKVKIDSRSQVDNVEWLSNDKAEWLSDGKRWVSDNKISM